MIIFLVFYPCMLFLFVGTVILFLGDFLSHWSILARGGLAYGIGIGSITVQMMLYSFFHIPWNVPLLIIPWVILFFIKAFMKKRIMKFTWKFRYVFTMIESILFAGIVTTIIFVIIEANIHPLLAFDGWANWFLGGKAFYLSNGISPQFIRYANNSTPPLISLMIAFVYLCIGHINDQVALFFFTGFYLALLVVFYAYARQYLSRSYALLFVFLLATIENVIRHAGRFDVGYADFPLGYYFFSATIFLITFSQKRTLQSFFLFQFFITTAALVKSEGISYYLISQGLMLYFAGDKRKITVQQVLIFVGSVLILISWYLFKHIYHLPENPFVRPQIGISRIFPVLFTMLKEFFNFPRWNFLWITYLIACLVSFRNKTARIVIIATLLQLVVYFGVYLTTPLDPVMHIKNSFDRLLLHITPLAMFLVSISITSQKREMLEKKK